MPRYPAASQRGCGGASSRGAGVPQHMRRDIRAETCVCDRAMPGLPFLRDRLAVPTHDMPGLDAIEPAPALEVRDEAPLNTHTRLTLEPLRLPLPYACSMHDAVIGPCENRSPITFRDHL